MKMYLVSLGCGLLVGVIYSLLQVRSPAPPVVALVGLLGMLLGEQAMPLIRWTAAQAKEAAAAGNSAAGDAVGGDPSPSACLDHLFGEMPSVHGPARATGRGG
ncbi:MAG: DUF1427 family protein, partial [Pseudomonadota bacterium]|nr:DUF1427 family protein [Pseudomonadota bacterium]